MHDEKMNMLLVNNQFVRKVSQEQLLVTCHGIHVGKSRFSQSACVRA